MESPPQTPGAEEDPSFQLSHITFALTFGNGEGELDIYAD
jgi:hypothetical protein